MRTFLVYFFLQIKRVLRLFPRLLAASLAVFLAGALAAGLLGEMRGSDAAFKRVRIGMVLAEGDSYARAGVAALRSFDPSRSEAEFIVMDEQEAALALRSGELTAYLIVPGDFFDTMYTENISPMRYVTLSGSTGADGLLLSEMAESIIRLMAETQAAEYGAVEFAREHFPDADPYEGYDRLIDRYFSVVLDRDKLVKVETVGYSGALSFAGHFFAGITLALCLFWGIGLSPFFSLRSREHGDLLSARALDSSLQVVAEAMALALAQFINAFLTLAAAIFIVRRAGISMPEELTLRSAIGVAGAAALTFGTMQQFIFELAPLPPGSLTAQFLSAAAQSFLAGCFYPRSFFPEPLRTLGKYSPVGAVLDFFGAVLSENRVGLEAALIWALVFLALTVAVRKLRERGDGG